MQPTWPFGKGRTGRKPPPFFAVDAQPGYLVALMMGLQHALAMIGGIITPPLLVYRTTIPPVRTHDNCWRLRMRGGAERPGVGWRCGGAAECAAWHCRA